MEKIYVNENSKFSKFIQPILGMFSDEEEGMAVTDQLINNPSFHRFSSLWDNATGRNLNKPLMALYEAYVCQECACSCASLNTRQKLLLRSLDSYYDFIKERKGSNEILYFAQWQSGLVKEKMGVEWVEVEETLLKASNFMRDRGEAMKHVIQYYRQGKEYGMAYIYSNIAKDQYFNITPSQMDWFGDHAFYQWKVLNYHLSICSHLGIEDEARTTQELLWKCYEEHPEYFSEEQQQQIFKNQKAFQQ